MLNSPWGEVGAKLSVGERLVLLLSVGERLVLHSPFLINVNDLS